MSTELWLLRLRRGLPPPSRLLSSFRLAFVLMVIGAWYFALLAVWAFSSSPETVGRIAALSPFVLLYAGIVTNATWCLTVRLPGYLATCRPAPWADGRAPSFSQQLPAAVTRSEVEAWLRRRGFFVRAQGEGGLWARRQRFAALGTVAFHASLLLLAVGFVASATTHREDASWIAVGEGWPQQAADGGPPVERLRLAAIRPAFWNDELLFTELAADVQEGEATRTMRINGPLWLSWNEFVRVSGFGYAPRYELLDPWGHVLESSVVKLKVFPPGEQDSFRLERFPYRVYLEVWPDGVIEGGAPATRSLNLREPLLGVRVFRGKLPVAAKLLRLGEELELEGQRLVFREVRYFGELARVRDAGAVPLVLGLVLGLAGLLVRLPGRRAEVDWRPTATGSLLRGFGDVAAPVHWGQG